MPYRVNVGGEGRGWWTDIQADRMTTRGEGLSCYVQLKFIKKTVIVTADYSYALYQFYTMINFNQITHP